MPGVLLRVVTKQSGLSRGAILVFAVGVGLAATVFGLADPYVSRSLPYADPDRLVSISFDLGDPTVQANQSDVPTLSMWQARTDLFEGVAALADSSWMRLRLSDRTIALRAVAVSPTLLDVLGYGSRTASDAHASSISRRAATDLSGGELVPGRSVPVLPAGRLQITGLIPSAFLLPQPNRTDPVDVLVHLPDSPVITIDRSRGVTQSRSLTLVGRIPTRRHNEDG